MTPNDVRPWPAKGQIWVNTDPLYLLRVTDLGSYWIEVERWTPNNSPEPMMYQSGLPDSCRHLWATTNVSRASYEVYDPQPGDVFFVADKGNHLIFIGPESNNTSVQFCTDWELDTHHHHYHLSPLQKASRDHLPNPTNWDRLKKG